MSQEAQVQDRPGYDELARDTHPWVIEAPFLHEKDLDTAKGGTRGFDAERRTPSSWPHGRRPRRRWTTRETRP